MKLKNSKEKLTKNCKEIIQQEISTDYLYIVENIFMIT